MKPAESHHFEHFVAFVIPARCNTVVNLESYSMCYDLAVQKDKCKYVEKETGSTIQSQLNMVESRGKSKLSPPQKKTVESCLKQKKSKRVQETQQEHRTDSENAGLVMRCRQADNSMTEKGTKSDTGGGKGESRLN